MADFSGGSDDKASVYHVGDLGSIPGSGSSLEKEMATHSSTLAWFFMILWTVVYLGPLPMGFLRQEY